MATFIEDFYYANIDPQARGVKKNSRVQKEMGVLAENEELLTERLTGEEKKLFLDYVNAWGIILGICALDSFTIGFRFGARFTYDTFVSKKVLFEDYLKG